MTVHWSQWQQEWELEEEAPRKWLSIPKLLPSGKMTVQPNGFAEIKPHNRAGIRAGLKQLGERARGKGRQPQALITYLPVDAALAPLPSGWPPHVRVFAVKYDHGNPPTMADIFIKHQWYDLGSFTPRKTIDLKVDNASVFGAVIEESVRKKFITSVLKAPLKYRGGGGAGTGPDVLWDELAQMYAELARDLRDPFYRELASELAALA